jgi:hypothetical protein
MRFALRGTAEIGNNKKEVCPCTPKRYVALSLVYYSWGYTYFGQCALMRTSTNRRSPYVNNAPPHPPPSNIPLESSLRLETYPNGWNEGTLTSEEEENFIVTVFWGSGGCTRLAAPKRHFNAKEMR